MRIPSPTEKRRARIEIIPLIDIVFFLLATFVMVSLSMVKNQGIGVNLPVAATGNAQKETTVTITVKESGEIFLNKTPVSIDTLASRLHELQATSPQLSVLINGDTGADFGNAVQVLDELRRLGIKSVSIRTKHE
ncbi:biopolymer transporter ExbD [bacterium]|nr:biopolymer transporter ExbD [bacterium]